METSILLEIINCVFQGVIAIAAVVGIWIAVKQISGRAKANLKMKAEFKLNESTSGDFYVELIIHMVNLSMAPVYISACGIELWDKRKRKYRMRISDTSFVLPSGESRTVTGQYINDMIDDNASLHDKIKIFAVCQMDRVIYEKKTISYDEFRHESEKISKRVNMIRENVMQRG